MTNTPNHQEDVAEPGWQVPEEIARLGVDRSAPSPSSATGGEVLLEVLRSEGVRHIFGNPGSTELPLIDALAGVRDLSYVLALQEAVAVGMADGYAQATGRPAFLNLHTSAGLGNGIGNLTNAQANGTPLVVTAGQQDRRHLETDPLLSGNLVGLAAPVAKWTHEVRSARELGTMMRRAFRDAALPPAGPVFVSIPMDVLGEPGAETPPRSDVRARVVPSDIGLLADLIGEASPGRLAIVLGDEVAASDALDAAVAVAEHLGAPVFASPLHSNVVFPGSHPLWRGSLGFSAEAVRSSLEPFDRVLLVGGRAFMAYPYTPGSPVPAHTDLLHLSPDPAQLGRAHPVRLGLVGDPRASLEALLAHLPLVPGAADALNAAEREQRAAREALDSAAVAAYGETPIAPAAAMHALFAAVGHDIPVVDEAITTALYLRSIHRPAAPGRYFFCRGGGLGWGMPAALGVSLARDRSPVLCIVGDGSAMYSPQALWTAAHERLPVLFVVPNNCEYLILKWALQGMGGETARTGNAVGMDLDDPPIDYVRLAESMGVSAHRVTTPGEVGDAAEAALRSGKPALVEVPIAA